VLNINGTDSTGVGIIAIGLKDVNVSGLSIVSGDSTKSIAGICFDNCGDSEIKDVYSEGFSKYGIWLRHNSFLCHINDCTAANNHQANIFTDSLFWSRAGEYMPNLITNCITYAGKNGIETNKSIVLNIVGCVVHQPGNFGFYIRNVSNSVLLSGCRTYQTQNNAVVVENSHEINITGNIFCWSRGKGIVLKGVNWGTITGNNIIDSGSERYGGFPGVGDANGVELTDKTKCIQITANNIFNWGGQGIMKYAIYEDESCSSNSFTSNNLNYFEAGGVFSKGKNSLVKDIVFLKSPSLNGAPGGTDPLFVPERLQKFIRE
jgi:parallel beta-helix repeat protein